MLSSIWGLVSRRSRVVAAAAAFAVTAVAAGSAARAADEAKPVEPKPLEAKPADLMPVKETGPRVGSAYSLQFATTATSHFISWGADVWGGGNELSPFSSHSTVFAEGTLTAKFGDNLSGYVNVWSDNNDNTDSGLGGPVQEVDLNAGLTLSLDGGFGITVANGYWMYGSDEEKIADLIIGWSDDGKIVKGFSLNPQVTFHYRYDGNGSQETGLAVEGKIKPTLTWVPEPNYPVTLAFPIAAAFFQDGFQGGDSGLGYVSAGVSASVPLKFIPAAYGLWTASLSATYYYTPEDQVPNNPNENFVVTAMSIGLSF